MKIKALAMAIAFLVMFSASAYAAGPAEPLAKPVPNKEMKQKRWAEKAFENLAKELSLTEEQKAECQKINQESREKIKPLMEQIQKIRKENMEAFEKILTPEQKEQFSKMKAEKKAKRFGKKGKGKKHHKP